MIAGRASYDTRRNSVMPQRRAQLMGLRLRQGRADDGPVTPFGARLQFVRSECALLVLHLGRAVSSLGRRSSLAT